MFLQVIGGVEFGTGGGALRFAPIIARSGEESFEAGPIFLLCGETFLGFAVNNKDIGLIDEMEGDANDLCGVVGSVTGGGVITAVFYPVEKVFNWLIDVIGGAEDSVVFLYIRGVDVGVCGV